MKVLITGICGFVGSTLARAWRESDLNLSLYGMDNFIRQGSESNRVSLNKLGVKLFHGDIRVASDFETLPPVDWVIDTAANPSVLAGIDGKTSSRQVVEHNLLGTLNILEYCRKYRAGFILLSTSRVYSLRPLAELAVEVRGEAFRPSHAAPLPPGLTDEGIKESFSTTPPVSLYGSTKLASETLALEYSDIFGFPVRVNRCGVLAGAGQFGRADQGIFSYWINAYLRRRHLTYIGFGGKGYQVRDCLHPRDLLPLLHKQIATDANGLQNVFNLGGGASHSMSLAQLSNWCAGRFGAHVIASEPAVRRFDIPWLVMDSSFARQTWDWKPQTNLDDILEEIASHAEQHPHWLELSGLG